MHLILMFIYLIVYCVKHFVISVGSYKHTYHTWMSVVKHVSYLCLWTENLSSPCQNARTKSGR